MNAAAFGVRWAMDRHYQHLYRQACTKAVAVTATKGSHTSKHWGAAAPTEAGITPISKGPAAAPGNDNFWTSASAPTLTPALVAAAAAAAAAQAADRCAQPLTAPPSPGAPSAGAEVAGALGGGNFAPEHLCAPLPMLAGESTYEDSAAQATSLRY